jgi:hypothetical protein
LRFLLPKAFARGGRMPSAPLVCFGATAHHGLKMQGRNILRLSSLRVVSEDWLLEKIFELGQSHLTLIGDIRFEYLSPRGIDLFFERISIFEMDDRMLQQLWIRSRHRIVYSPTDIVCDDGRYSDLVCRSPDSPWSGLIAHLGRLCEGNVHTQGFMNISCSSTCQNQCWDVVNYDWNNYWYTGNSPNSWIQFDFKDRVVSLTHYALKSDGNNAHHLVEWTVQGSIDGISWTDLDRRHTQELNNTSVTKIFSCNVPFSQPHFYRFIQLMQNGKNGSGSDNLMLGNFECFGSMVTASPIEVVRDGNPPNS